MLNKQIGTKQDIARFLAIYETQVYIGRAVLYDTSFVWYSWSCHFKIHIDTESGKGQVSGLIEIWSSEPIAHISRCIPSCMLGRTDFCVHGVCTGWQLNINADLDLYSNGVTVDCLSSINITWAEVNANIMGVALVVCNHSIRSINAR